METNNISLRNYIKRSMLINNDTNKVELELITRYEVCSIKVLNIIRNNIGGLDSRELKKILREEYYNPLIMKSTTCIIQSLYKLPSEGSITSIDRIKNLLTNLKLIGVPSLEGNVFKIGIENLNDVFVIKTPRNTKNNLTHELFVGLILTGMRKYVLNFSYTFAGFKCSRSFITDSSIISWCNTPELSTDFIVSEIIDPSISLTNFVETCLFEDFLNMFLQVLYSLDRAYKRYDFTHYDLHSGNVLLRKLYDKVYIPYFTENGTEYIKTNFIATIIDFGQSHIKYQGKSFGFYGLIQFGNNPESSFPMHDAYKLLITSMFYMKKADNLNCFNQSLKLLDFFDTKKSFEEYQFFIKYNENLAKVVIFDFIKYIRSYIPVPFITSKYPEDAKIFGCPETGGEDLCFPEDDKNFYERIGLTKNLYSDTIFEFYDLASRLKNQNKISELNKAKENFNYIEIIKNARNYLDLLYKEMRYLFLLNFVSIGFINIRNELQRKDYSNILYKIIYFYDLFQKTNIIIKAVEFTALEFKDIKLLNEINNIKIILSNNLYKKFYQLLDLIKIDADLIKNSPLKVIDEILYNTIIDFSNIIQKVI
uniref:Protein kinase n=1 Tax=Pithovirus LCPAC104 TaxID=2506589 RepID=A0A481Z415_9VIRU|nr:MAG: protein kinase [Pithovirus LCPAC104]